PVASLFQLLEDHAHLVDEVGPGLSAPSLLVVRAGRRATAEQLPPDVLPNSRTREFAHQSNRPDRKGEEPLRQPLPTIPTRRPLSRGLVGWSTIPHQAAVVTVHC